MKQPTRQQIVTALVVARLMMSHSNEAYALRAELEGMDDPELMETYNHVTDTISKELRVTFGMG